MESITKSRKRQIKKCQENIFLADNANNKKKNTDSKRYSTEN